MKYQSDIDKAIVNKKEIEKSLQRFKKKKPKFVDELFEDLHNKAFKSIDCLSCANCCKTTSPIFRDVDIKRIAKRFRVNEMQFISTYLRMDEDRDYVLKTSPCTFLGADNKCDIYEDRPLACREYPHTNRKNMSQILDLTLKNSEICPAVARIVEEIKEKHP
jgi:Fe-S-cluster containining protein